jgi:hypothetical protein
LSFIAGRSEVDDLDDGALQILQQNVFWLQIAVDQSGLVEQGQPVKQLLREYPDQRCAKAAELVLLDQFVEVDTQELENKTEMLPVDEGIL